MSAILAVFLTCFVLNSVYYAVARRALELVRVEDPARYNASGAKGGVGMSNSLGIISLLFDRSLPRQSYSRSLKRMLWCARLMLLVGVVLLVVLIVLMAS